MANVLSVEEYIKLINEIINMDSELDDGLPSCWEQDNCVEEIKSKMHHGIRGSINLSTAKRSEIIKLLKNQEIIQVYTFMIKLNEIDGIDDSFDVKIYERRTKTPTGAQCNIDYILKVAEDSRFQNCDWAKYFIGKFDSTGRKVPKSKLPEIIKYLQAVYKIPAFL